MDWNFFWGLKNTFKKHRKHFTVSSVFVSIIQFFLSFSNESILFFCSLKHIIRNYEFTICRSNYTMKLLVLENATHLPQWTENCRSQWKTCRKWKGISVDGESSVTVQKSHKIPGKWICGEEMVRTWEMRLPGCKGWNRNLLLVQHFLLSLYLNTH